MKKLVMKYLCLSADEASTWLSEYEGTYKEAVLYVYQAAQNRAYCGELVCRTPQRCAAAIAKIDIEFNGLL